MRAELERDGYVIARNLLTPEEIAKLRSRLLQHFSQNWRWEGLGKHQPAAANAIPSISWIFSHPPILTIFRELTATDALVFTGNSDAHMNMLSWWHKDTAESIGGCFKGDYFSRKNLLVYRAGIYLQDHESDNHGLHVRLGSHHTRSANEGDAKSLCTRAGDVVFFDPRLSHAGQFPDFFERVLLRIGGKLHTPASLYLAKEGWRRLLRKQTKLSLFFTYGASGPDTDDYCVFEAKARGSVGQLAIPSFPSRLLTNLAAQGVSCNPWLVTQHPQKAAQVSLATSQVDPVADEGAPWFRPQ